MLLENALMRQIKHLGALTRHVSKFPLIHTLTRQINPLAVGGKNALMRHVSSLWKHMLTRQIKPLRDSHTSPNEANKTLTRFPYKPP